jgi:DNA-directed RNA polymerase I subunit RPA2
LIAKGEHAEEFGGYFIIGGHERLIRMLQMTRRNYPFTVTRAAWKQRGLLFSDMGVMIRCVKDDQTATVSIWRLIKINKTDSMHANIQYIIKSVVQSIVSYGI